MVMESIDLSLQSVHAMQELIYRWKTDSTEETMIKCLQAEPPAETDCDRDECSEYGEKNVFSQTTVN